MELGANRNQRGKLDLDGTRASLLQHVAELKNWEEKQLQQLRHMQKAQLTQVQEGQRRIDKLLKMKKSAGSETSSLEETVKKQMEKLNMPNEDKQNMVGDDEIKIQNIKKRPFLKKGEGLQRFRPDRISYDRKKNQTPKLTNNTLEGSPMGLVQNLKSEPAVNKNTKVKKVHFKEATDFVKVSSTASASHLPFQSKAELLRHCLQNVRNNPGNAQLTRKAVNDEIGFTDRQKESEELAEFEVLENAVDNTSLSSDSSVLQNVLKGEPRKVDKLEPFSVSDSIEKSVKDISDSTSCTSSSSGLQQIADLYARKIYLESLLSCYSDVDTGITSSKIDTSNSDMIHVKNNDTTNIALPVTSVYDGEVQNSMLSSSSGSSVITSDIDEAVISICGPNPEIPDLGTVCSIAKEQAEKIRSDQEVKSMSVEIEDTIDTSTCHANKSTLISKLRELDEEIEIYKKNNSQLTKLNKQREEEIWALQRNRDEFDRFKVEEKNKLEKEISDKRMQMRREKQTFDRYQKLRKDMPCRKEREEWSSLRQQITSLQEEIKKQSIKSSTECRRLRKLLSTAERERDSLKLENEGLESHRLDLLAALRAKDKLSKESFYLEHEKLGKLPSTSDIEESEPLEDPAVTDICDSVNKEEGLGNALHEDYVPMKLVEEMALGEEPDGSCELAPSNPRKNHVRFDLKPSVKRFSLESADMEYHEIHDGDRVLKKYTNGETEMLYPTGTRKYTSSDGTHIKFFFYNGDTKEILGDKKIVYKFADGSQETCYPDGLTVIEFPNKQVERLYPDGIKQIIFPDGLEKLICLDGSEETRLCDGTVVKLFSDGTAVIEYPDGQKEFRTDDYMRREYPNGAVRTVYKSGRTETRYHTGRLKVTDKNGKIIVDIRS